MSRNGGVDMDRTDDPGPITEGVPSASWAPARVAIPAETGFLRRVSWGAIFAGAVIAMVCQLALTCLGLAIGLGTINPYTETGTMQGLGVGALVWMLLTTI